jgi:DNA repair protein RadC
MVLSTKIKTDKSIRNPEDAYAIFRKISRKKQEYFTVLTLDSAHVPLKFHIVTIGTLNKTLVHPREIFRPALFDNAAAVIVGHNHPSGLLTPSNEDSEITDSLTQAANILGIAFLDHIIVTKKGFSSLKGFCPASA